MRQHLDMIIIAIRKPDDRMVFNPKADTVFEAGDVIVVVGCARSLKQLERMQTLGRI